MERDESTRCLRCGGPLAADRDGAADCPACLLSGATADSAAETEGPQSRFRAPEPQELAPLLPALEIVRLIGQGGMGAVYEARQRSLDRRVALKVLSPEVASRPEFAERFERESRTLAGLDHPGLVTVHDSGIAGEFYYFVMEFVDGTHLRDLAAAQRLSPREALGIVPQICDALQYAHDHGVVHRDIKPENILVDRRGRVKIADFGLAKLLARSPGDVMLTATRVTLGTPAYMAPEQLERPEEVDHRADIYSLGVVFYELLTGELPLGRFDAPSQRVALDVRLDEIVLRTLEKEPARRYQHASDIGTDVRHMSEGSGAPPEVSTARSDSPIKDPGAARGVNGAGAATEWLETMKAVSAGWVAAAIVGFAACGIALGLLWNLGPGGLAAGTLLLAGVTYACGSSLRRRVPILQEGWQRSSRSERSAAVAAMVLLVAGSVAVWSVGLIVMLDGDRMKPMEQPPQSLRDASYWGEMVEESGLGGALAEGEARLGGAFIPRRYPAVLALLWVLGGLIFQLGASTLALGPSRLRGSRRYSIPLTAILAGLQWFALLALVAGAGLPSTFERYSESAFAVAGDYEQVSSRLDDWLQVSSYDVRKSAHGRVYLEETDERVGSFRRVLVYPTPAWRRWNWRWGKSVLERPVFSVELYGPSGGGETAVRLRTAFVRRDMEDRELWELALYDLRRHLERPGP